MLPAELVSKLFVHLNFLSNFLTLAFPFVSDYNALLVTTISIPTTKDWGYIILPMRLAFQHDKNIYVCGQASQNKQDFGCSTYRYLTAYIWSPKQDM